MFKNYITVAWRSLRRNRLYALVNILGLAVGIASCMLIGLYIARELSYDRFHANADRLARATWEYKFDDKAQRLALTGTRVGPEFKRSFPEVEAYTRTLKYPRVIGYQDKLFEEKNFLYADSAFFGMFSFPLLRGDAASVLAAPDRIVLTQTLARKYFGDTDPIGQSVKVGTKDLIVSGIAADPPENSQIRFDAVAAFTGLAASREEKWNEANYITYFLLRKGTDLAALNVKSDQHFGAVMRNEMHLQGSSYSKYHLEPLTSVHLHSGLEGFEPNGNATYLYILSVVAILILLIACVNYTNLSTAQSTDRSAEVGMRKVFGAAKKQVFSQFMAESLLLTGFSVVLAIVFSALILPYFNQLAGTSFHISVLLQPAMLAGLLALGVVVAFFAGLYPALMLSRGRIINILKSGFRFNGSSSLRRSLIVLQFGISIFLIIATIVILQQLSYVRNKDLGYDKEQVLVLPVDNRMQAGYDDLKAAMALVPGVRSVSGAYTEPVNVGWSDGMNKGGEYSETGRIAVTALPVDEDFIKTMNLKIVAGGDFTDGDVKSFDTSDGGAHARYTYMLNEEAAKELGWTPEEAVGQYVTKGQGGIVRAVVKDFHFRSLHEPIGPMLIFLDKRMVGSMFVKLSGNVPAAIEGLQKLWKERIPYRPFEYHFLDEDYDALYRAEARAGGVFTTFAVIALLLACLGLFALTAYAMVQRRKEIGIRKVLGATVPDILQLVSVDFLKLVLIALVIASPLAFYASKKWLDGFSYKISIAWWVFALAASAILLIAFVTISLQAIRTAAANPVKNLRTE